MATANIKATLLCPVEKVWEVVTDLQNYQWRSDLIKIETVKDDIFFEISKQGIKTEFKVVKKETYKLWEFKIENDNIKGLWTGKFYRHGEHTTLDFTENVRAKKFYIIPFLGVYLRKQQRQYFSDLKKRLDCDEAGKKQFL